MRQTGHTLTKSGEWSKLLVAVLQLFEVDQDYVIRHVLCDKAYYFVYVAKL